MSKIAFVNTLKVPSGEASVNRILSLSKGLVENGDEVNVLSSNVNEEYDNGQEIDGIKIYNLGKHNTIYGLFGSLRRIIAKILKEKYDVIISTTNNLPLIYSLAASCKISGTKFIQEKSEFPFMLMKNDIFHKIYGRLYVNTTYKLMDAMVIMTEPLLEYYKTKARKDCIFIHVPMTVDPTRFETTAKVNFDYPYVAYCGNMSGNKDGVENLIEAFYIVEQKCPDLKLLLIGGTNNSVEFERLKAKVTSLGCKNIIFYGRANRDEIPMLLKNAKILALARPSSLQATGGFPTKLGEYLSTGNPTVVTSVGDIPNYLNNENSFIVKPDDNKQFAGKIIEVWQDYPRAKEIASKGKMVVKKVFDYRVQARRLHHFIKEIK